MAAKIVLKNNELCNLIVNIDDFYYGASVFTTFRTVKRQALWWDEHITRLCNHARHFGFFVPGEAQLQQSVDKLISHTAKEKTELKIRFTLSAHDFWASAQAYEPPLLSCYEGVKLHWSDYVVHPQLARFKTGNYLPYLLAFEQAQKAQCFEALLCNSDNLIIDGSRSSPLVYENDCLLIPEGGLESISRQKICQEANSIGIKCYTTKIAKNNIAGQILLSSSTMGLIPTNQVQCPKIKHLIRKFCPHL